MALTFKQTMLHRAAKLLRGKDKLAVRLNVLEELLDAWMDGSVEMPDLKMPRLAAILKEAGDQTREGY